MKTVVIFACFLLVACATPVTTLQNPKTKQAVTCGGDMSGFAAGGMIGYNMQQDSDAECVKNYKNLGFKVVEPQSPTTK